MTIDDVIARLSDITASARRASNRAGYFAALYRTVTIAVKQGIADGRFEDGPRMERLDVLFASRHLEAFDAFQRGAPVTRSWRVALEATGPRRHVEAHPSGRCCRRCPTRGLTAMSRVSRRGLLSRAIRLCW